MRSSIRALERARLYAGSLRLSLGPDDRAGPGSEGGVKSRSSCTGHLDELDRMVHTLSEQSEAVATRVSRHFGSIKLSDPALAELDAFFYSVVAKVVEIRVDADDAVDATVSRATFDTK